MAVSKRGLVWLALLGALSIGGCADFLDEARMYHLREELAPYQRAYYRFMTPRDRMVYYQPVAQPQPCAELPLERRVTQQNGVSEPMVSIQCWQSPYYASGMRMGNRPEQQVLLPRPR